MRYYDITLIPQGGGQPVRHWSSHPNFTYDPGALNVEFDMPIVSYGTPAGAMALTIHGVAREDISQAYQFAGMELSVSGGMKAGLPLANPNQAGVLLRGQVFQAFGNWEGTDMRLDLIVYPSRYTIDDPGNFILFWNAGQSLAEALTATLTTAYPEMPISINIGDNLVFDYPEAHYCATLEELAQLVADITHDVFKQKVTITIQAGKIVIYDTTHKPNPIEIQFTDLIGQPTWINQGIMQMKTVMRADLQVGSIIRMQDVSYQGQKITFPNAPGFTTTFASSALSEYGGGLSSTGKDSLTFKNNFAINELRHIGNYRSVSGEDWCTIFNCAQGA